MKSIRFYILGVLSALAVQFAFHQFKTARIDESFAQYHEGTTNWLLKSGNEPGFDFVVLGQPADDASGQRIRTVYILPNHSAAPKLAIKVDESGNWTGLGISEHRPDGRFLSVKFSPEGTGEMEGLFCNGSEYALMDLNFDGFADRRFDLRTAPENARDWYYSPDRTIERKMGAPICDPVTGTETKYRKFMWIDGGWDFEPWVADSNG